MSPIAFGIDFGTSNSSMAWYDSRQNRPMQIRNRERNLNTPSLVYFGPDEILVGQAVENLLEDKGNDPTVRRRVIRSIKRDLTYPPFIPLPGAEIDPIDVVSQILGKLKGDAEKYVFKETVDQVVITHPAEFKIRQKRILREAARRIGFKEIGLIEEPVAAAIAYGKLDRKPGENVLVYDLGGGTFDLALVSRSGDDFNVVVEPGGEAVCGGDDFDQALYDYCDQLARKNYKRPFGPEGALDLRLLARTRKWKERLSAEPEVLASVFLVPEENYTEIVHFEQTILRKDFEVLIHQKVAKTVRKTRRMLDRAKEEGFPVDSVVLIGGSIEIPLVRQRLEKELDYDITNFLDQDIAVALGAACRAWELYGPSQKRPRPSPVGPSPALRQYEAAVKMAIADSRLEPEEVVLLESMIDRLGLTPEETAEVERRHFGMRRDEFVERHAKGGLPPLPSRRERLLLVFDIFTSAKDFYLGRKIPAKKLEAFVKTCGVPAEEEILAIIDTSLYFGRVVQAIIFTENGFFYYNWSGRKPGKGQQSYEDFTAKEIRERKLSKDIQIGKDHAINVGGAALGMGKIVEILQEVQEQARR